MRNAIIPAMLLLLLNPCQGLPQSVHIGTEALVPTSPRSHYSRYVNWRPADGETVLIDNDGEPDVLGKNGSQRNPTQIRYSDLSVEGLAAEQARRWQAAIRDSLFVPDPLPPLDPTNHGRFEPAAIDPRLHACVLVGGGNLDGPGGNWDRSKPMCQSIPYKSLMFLRDRGAALYALHALRGPTLVFNGLADTVVSIPDHGKPFFDDLRERTARLLGRRAGIFEVGLVPDVSHRPFFVTEPVALWLEEHLDFPDWTPATIREMPTTHVSQWVKENNVAVDPRYASEDREGGVQALGVGVPGLSRAQLSVFTDQQWQEQRDRLIYEAWVRKARARVGLEH